MNLIPRLGQYALLALATLLLAHQAPAADWYSKSLNIASGVSVATNTTVASTGGTASVVPQNVDLVIQTTVAGAAAGTSNSILGFNLSTDGTNYSTSLPITATVAANGTTNSTGWTIISRTNLTGAKYIRYDSLTTTQTNALTVSAILLNYFY